MNYVMFMCQYGSIQSKQGWCLQCIIYLQLGDSQWEKHLRIPTDVIMDLTEFIQQNDQFEFDSEHYP